MKLLVPKTNWYQLIGAVKRQSRMSNSNLEWKLNESIIPPPHRFVNIDIVGYRFAVELLFLSGTGDLLCLSNRATSCGFAILSHGKHLLQNMLKDIDKDRTSFEKIKQICTDKTKVKK